MRPPREDTEPWYKQFWPWFLISLPLSVVIASIVTINLAIKTDDGLVSDDYYKEGLAIHRDADRTAKAKALGIAANLGYDAETGALRVAIDNANAELPGILTLEVVHPTRPDNDRLTQLTAVAPGHYAGRIEPIVAANWRLKLQPEDGKWRISGRLRVPGDGNTRLD